MSMRSRKFYQEQVGNATILKDTNDNQLSNVEEINEDKVFLPNEFCYLKAFLH